MIQCRERLGFTIESGQTIGVVCDSFWQDLDGDSPAQVRVRRLIDLAHASCTDPRRDLVWT
jgi:hypothetical protein